MICHHRTDPIISKDKADFQKGFTLLEIVIVLAVTGLIIGGSIATLVLNSSERLLRNTSSEVELLAKKARAAAILNQTPYAIQFHPDRIKLLPYAETQNRNLTTALENEINDADSELGSRRALHDELIIDPQMILTIQHWNTENFIIPSENQIPVWRFDPDGLCEPITVRFARDGSYVEDTYHPLTAAIADSKLEAN